MRAFVAIEISDQMRWEVAALARRLEAQVAGRFVVPENYHVTLAFLGDVAEREIGLAIEALETACAGQSAPFLTCDGLGKFGKASDATLWLGLTQTDALENIAAAVRDELSSREIAFDDKPFKAHLTLARRAAIPKADLPPLPFPEPTQARCATLFKSELDQQGAIYTPLYSVEFV